jgi:hypothetical protein
MLPTADEQNTHALASSEVKEHSIVAKAAAVEPEMVYLGTSAFKLTRPSGAAARLETQKIL